MQKESRERSRCSFDLHLGMEFPAEGRNASRSNVAELGKKVSGNGLEGFERLVLWLCSLMVLGAEWGIDNMGHHIHRLHAVPYIDTVCTSLDHLSTMPWQRDQSRGCSVN